MPSEPDSKNLPSLVLAFALGGGGTFGAVQFTADHPEPLPVDGLYQTMEKMAGTMESMHNTMQAYMRNTNRQLDQMALILDEQERRILKLELEK